MLPKPTKKSRGAIVSEASTAPLLFLVGLSVAGKKWCAVGLFAPFLGDFRWFLGDFWLLKGVFWSYYQDLRGVLADM